VLASSVGRSAVMLHVALGLIFLIEGALILPCILSARGCALLAFGGVEVTAAVLFI
jgi:hypothetical protein